MDDSQSQTWRDLDAIPWAYRIYLVNYEELARKVRVLDDPGQWLPIISVGSGALIPFLQEVERLLHNCLAAAFTLSSTINAAAPRLWAEAAESSSSQFRGAKCGTCGGSNTR